jgi:hypothetical protein
MATSADYSRGIVMTASGQAYNNPITVSGVTIVALTADTLVYLRDGNATGPIVWRGEADNAASSFSKTFNPPLRFYHKVYVEFASIGAGSAITLEVIQPHEPTN